MSSPKLLFIAILGAAAAGIVAPPLARAAQPAFDCAKATHEIELLICKDNELAALDVKMDRVFKAATKQPLSAEQLAELKTYQRGWIGGRDECWKEKDKKQCAVQSYVERIVKLQARYGLLQAGKSAYWNCDGSKMPLIVTPFKTDPPSVNLVRGDEVTTAILRPSGSGSKYEADFAVIFWEKGREATLNWPQDKTERCIPQK
jgi:uncharacterized protein